MSDIRHGTTEELLPLRDGEGSAWPARASFTGWIRCARG